jgi:predicted dehydrogenase
MRHDKIRVGIIGAGRIAGLVHVPSMRLWPDACEIVGVASRSLETAQRFADQWQIPRSYSDWRALVADSNVDAVVVCVPSGLTAVVAMSAVTAQKHVLCEKPLGVSSAEALDLLAATWNSPAVHMVAFTYRFVPALRYLKRLITEGHFGEIRHWRMSYIADGMLEAATPASWRNDRTLAGAGVLADMGSHAIDAARYLVGDIVAVSGASRLYAHDRPDPSGMGHMPVDAEDAYALTVEFANGAIGTFDVNRAVAGRGGGGRANYQSIEIHGTGGSALYELRSPLALQVSLGAVMTRTQQWTCAAVPHELMKIPGSPRNPWAGDPLFGYKLDQGITFLRAIREETCEYPTFHDGAAVQRVIDAADQAARTRCWVDVRAQTSAGPHTGRSM